MNPLSMSILLLLFEAGALLILVSWAMYKLHGHDFSSLAPSVQCTFPKEEFSGDKHGNIMHVP